MHPTVQIDKSILQSGFILLPRHAVYSGGSLPQKVALRCSAGSLVLRHSPTSPERARPPLGLWPSRTGLDRLTKTCRRSPGSRACCFSACAGSKTTQDLAIHSRLVWLSCCLPPLGIESASCSIGFSKLNSPAHRYLCLRFKRYLAVSPARLEARMDSLFPFLYRSFIPYNMPVYPGALRVAND